MSLRCIIVLWALIFAIGSVRTDPIVPVETTPPHINNTLLFAHVIFRHGSRSPTNCYPTDPHCNSSTWCDGPGQLSNIGKRQQYDLGRWLRKRYGSDGVDGCGGFLPQRYSYDDVFVESMDAARILNAAYVTMAGLYPPMGDQVWLPGMAWQPIPVRSTPRSQAYMMGFPWSKSKYFQRLFDAVVESKEVRAYMASKAEIIDYTNKWAGFQPNKTWDNIWNMEIMRNNLRITTEYKLEIPDWSRRLLNNDEIEDISMLKYVLPVRTSALAKFSAGYFLKTILDRCQEKFDGTLKPNRRMWVYSVREINQIVLMHVLGVFDNKRPLFAATLLLELRTDNDGDPCLEIFYKKSGDHDEATPLKIPRCGFRCKLSTIREMCASILPTDDELKAAKKSLEYPERKISQLVKP